jgi:hypothetical protein
MLVRGADGRTRHLLSSLLAGRKVRPIIEGSCKKEGISVLELRSGSRHCAMPLVRSHLAWRLARELGVPLAEVGQQLGVDRKQRRK